MQKVSIVLERAIDLLKMTDSNPRGVKRGRDEVSSSDTEETIRTNEPAVEACNVPAPARAVGQETQAGNDESGRTDTLVDLQAAFPEVSILT